MHTGCARQMREIAVALHRLPNRDREAEQVALTRRFSERLCDEPIAIRLFGSLVLDNRLLESVINLLRVSINNMIAICDMMF